MTTVRDVAAFVTVVLVLFVGCWRVGVLAIAGVARLLRWERP